jgi:hypothetical protein
VSESRRLRREQARKLAKELMRTGGAPREQASKFDFVGFLGGPVLALILFLLSEKVGRFATVVCLVLIFGFLLYSALKLRWVRNASSPFSWQRVLTLTLVPIVVVAIGLFVWPIDRRPVHRGPLFYSEFILCWHPCDRERKR